MASSAPINGSPAKESSWTGDDSWWSEEEESGGDSPKERRNLLELLREVTASILSRLVAVYTLASAQFVCRSWFEICKDPLVWRKIDVFNIGDPDLNLDLDKMCRNAVDCSGGQAVDINIEYFGNDDLLKYITDRSNQIKRLWLTCCYHVSDEALIEAFAKLPLLKELDLTLCPVHSRNYRSCWSALPSFEIIQIELRSFLVRSHKS